MTVVQSIISPVVKSIVSPVVMQSASGAPVADSLLTDLVAWWSLNEASGTRVNAHNPGTHDLTDNNTVGQTAGVVGNAANFVAASNEYLSLAHHADFVIADSGFTVSGWALLSTGSGGTARLIARGNPSVPNGEWIMSRTSANNVNFRVRNAANAGSVACAAQAVTYDTLFFFTLEHDPVNDLISLTINLGTPTTAALAGGVYSGTNELSIGMVFGLAFSEWDGTADEVAVWRRLLTTDEKNRLYNSGSGMAYPG